MVSMVALAASAIAGVAAAEPMAGDGPGCKDKAIAAKLLLLQDSDPAYIEIWATGMVDGSCRGYSAGVEVTVEDRGAGMACVKATDDDACFWVRESMAPQ
jgi:hypothetical protein